MHFHREIKGRLVVINIALAFYLFSTVAEAKLENLKICNILNEATTVLSGIVVKDRISEKTREFLIQSQNPKDRAIPLVVKGKLVGSRDDLKNLLGKKIFIIAKDLGEKTSISYNIVSYPWGIIQESNVLKYGGPIIFENKNAFENKLKSLMLSEIIKTQKCL